MIRERLAVAVEVGCAAVLDDEPRLRVGQHVELVVGILRGPVSIRREQRVRAHTTARRAGEQGERGERESG